HVVACFRSLTFLETVLLPSLNPLFNGTTFSGRIAKYQFFRIFRIELCTIANSVERRQNVMFWQSERVHERQREGGQADSA
ncbi:MAG: hypothetical protein IIZ18_04755, partial [Ruminococcus sp.]|nr:hypothetical protein [Ruminococcus sp.]